jgi:hypothetical protein
MFKLKVTRRTQDIGTSGEPHIVDVEDHSMVDGAGVEIKGEGPGHAGILNFVYREGELTFKILCLSRRARVRAHRSLPRVAGSRLA